MSVTFQSDYEEMRDECAARNMARRHEIARRSCCDGFCGAPDCVTCRGEAALAEIFEEEPDL